MKDLMANTVGTVELQQLKQKHEQKVNQLRLTSPVCARQCSPSPLLSSQAKPCRHLSLTPYPHPALMWMTWGGGNGDAGAGYAVHLPPCWLHWSVSYIYVVEVLKDFVCVFIVIVSYNSTPLYSSGIDTHVSGVCVYIILMCFSCPVVAVFIALPLIFTTFLTWFLFCFS